MPNDYPCHVPVPWPDDDTAPDPDAETVEQFLCENS